MHVWQFTGRAAKPVVQVMHRNNNDKGLKSHQLGITHNRPEDTRVQQVHGMYLLSAETDPTMITQKPNNLDSFAQKAVTTFEWTLSCCSWLTLLPDVPTVNTGAFINKVPRRGVQQHKRGSNPAQGMQESNSTAQQ